MSAIYRVREVGTIWSMEPGKVLRSTGLSSIHEFSGKNTGGGSHPFSGIFQTQRSNPGLTLLGGWILYSFSHQGSLTSYDYNQGFEFYYVIIWQQPGLCLIDNVLLKYSRVIILFNSKSLASFL